MKISNGDHRINREKPRTKKTGGPKWWVNTQRRLDCKNKACALVEQRIGREVAKTGKRIYTATNLIFDQIAREFADVFAEYERDHGKPVSKKILGDRVHKMFYFYGDGKKSHGLSSEHPQNQRALHV